METADNLRQAESGRHTTVVLVALGVVLPVVGSASASAASFDEDALWCMASRLPALVYLSVTMGGSCVVRICSSHAAHDGYYTPPPACLPPFSPRRKLSRLALRGSCLASACPHPSHN